MYIGPDCIVDIMMDNYFNKFVLIILFVSSSSVEHHILGKSSARLIIIRAKPKNELLDIQIRSTSMCAWIHIETFLY